MPVLDKDRNCKSCAHLDGEHCKKWGIYIPNIHAFGCSHYKLKKDFLNLGKVLFERPTQELRYEYNRFRVADMEYKNYHTMELYSEGFDHFSFSYYYVYKGKGNENHIVGHLTVNRMLRDKKIGNGKYVDKPYWDWTFDGEEHFEVTEGILKLPVHGEDNYEASISISKLRAYFDLIDRVESSKDPLNVPEGYKVQYINSEKYNTLKE